MKSQVWNAVRVALLLLLLFPALQVQAQSDPDPADDADTATTEQEAPEQDSPEQDAAEQNDAEQDGAEQDGAEQDAAEQDTAADTAESEVAAEDVPEEPIELRVYEDASNTQFLDLRGNGEGIGDMYLWNLNPLLDVETGEEIGYSNGFCINTIVLPELYAAECEFTLTLPNGSLRIAGTSYNDGILTIVGGTGEYFDAVGTLDQVYDADESRYLYTIVIGEEAPEPETDELRFFEINTSTRVVDMGEVGNSAGDMYLKNQNPLFNSRTGEEIGSSSGYCIVISAGEDGFIYECAYTVTFSDGSIYVAGTSYDEGDLPILGGTGKYAGAVGLLTEQYNAEENLFEYTVRFGTDVEPSGLGRSPAVAATEEDEADEEAGDGAETADGAAETAPADETPADETSGDESADSLEEDKIDIITGVRQPQENVAEFWRGFAWSELSTSERSLWRLLGWNETNWGSTTNAPGTASLTWQNLTELQITAAEELGFDEETWNAARLP